MRARASGRQYSACCRAPLTLCARLAFRPPAFFIRETIGGAGPEGAPGHALAGTPEGGVPFSTPLWPMLGRTRNVVRSVCVLGSVSRTKRTVVNCGWVRRDLVADFPFVEK